jgi:hypothetical protein
VYAQIFVDFVSCVAAALNPLSRRHMQQHSGHRGRPGIPRGNVRRPEPSTASPIASRHLAFRRRARRLETPPFRRCVAVLDCGHPRHLRQTLGGNAKPPTCFPRSPACFGVSEGGLETVGCIFLTRTISQLRRSQRFDLVGSCTFLHGLRGSLGPRA